MPIEYAFYVCFGIACGYLVGSTLSGARRRQRAIENFEEKTDEGIALIDDLRRTLKLLYDEMLFKRTRRDKHERLSEKKMQMKGGPLLAMAERCWVCQINQPDPNGKIWVRVDNVRGEIPEGSQVMIGTRAEFFANVAERIFVKWLHGGELYFTEYTRGLADDDFVWVMDPEAEEHYKKLLNPSPSK